MSYDLAVWEGDEPADNAMAGEVFTQLYDRYIDTDEEFPPSPRIAEYVAALLARWVDLTEDEEDTSPWSTGPLIGEAAGPFIYFPMRYSMAKEASAYAAELAASMGLVCFDPQAGGLRPGSDGAADGRGSVARRTRWSTAPRAPVRVILARQPSSGVDDHGG